MLLSKSILLQIYQDATDACQVLDEWLDGNAYFFGDKYAAIYAPALTYYFTLLDVDCNGGGRVLGYIRNLKHFSSMLEQNHVWFRFHSHQ